MILYEYKDMHSWLRHSIHVRVLLLQLQRCKLIYLKLNLIPVLWALQLRKFLISYGPHCSVIEQGIEFRYDWYQISSITTCPLTCLLPRKKEDALLLWGDCACMCVCWGKTSAAAFYSALSTQHRRQLFINVCIHVLQVGVL